MNAVLLDRAALERGFLESMIVSGLGHALVVGIAVAITLLSPREPLIKVMPGFMISLPPGGAGSPVAAPAAPAPAPPVTQAAAPKVEPPPQILKPVQELPRKGIADIDEKPSSKKPPKPQPVQVSGSGAASPGANATPGFALGPPGAGVPGGTDPFGDWYLAGVQRKIWMVWAQQVKAGMTQPAMVSFTILADGSVDRKSVV